jgi:hypothetical protein
MSIPSWWRVPWSRSSPKLDITWLRFWTGKTRWYSKGEHLAGLGAVGIEVVEPGVVVVDWSPTVVVVESGRVVDVVVEVDVVVVDSLGTVVGEVGRRGGVLGGNRSSMVIGGHMTAASTGAGEPPTTSKAAVMARTATMAAPNLPGVIGPG